MNDELIIEIWSIFKEFVPNKNRKEMAETFLQTLIDYNIDIENMDDLHGQDAYLDKAFEVIFSNEEDEEEYEE